MKKKKEPWRFIVEPYIIRTAIIKETNVTFVKSDKKTKNIALPFCGLQKEKEEIEFLLWILWCL